MESQSFWHPNACSSKKLDGHGKLKRGRSFKMPYHLMSLQFAEILIFEYCEKRSRLVANGDFKPSCARTARASADAALEGALP